MLTPRPMGFAPRPCAAAHSRYLTSALLPPHAATATRRRSNAAALRATAIRSCAGGLNYPALGEVWDGHAISCAIISHRAGGRRRMRTAVTSGEAAACCGGYSTSAAVAATAGRLVAAAGASGRRVVTAYAVEAHGSASVGGSEVRPVAKVEELEQVAQLRAEAYYEDDHSRFVESFKQKFVRQEVDALRERTRASKKGAPFCECLVLLRGEASSGGTGGRATVLGCIDIRLPRSATDSHPTGVPDDDVDGCYLLNVVVDEDARGRGVGRELMRAAMRRAVKTWGAKRMYTHVAADNEVAFRLYTGCGFEEHSSNAAFRGASQLGKLVLLQADAATVADEAPPTA